MRPLFIVLLTLMAPSWLWSQHAWQEVLPYIPTGGRGGGNATVFGDTIFFPTPSGLYMSTDDAMSWKNISKSLAYRSVNDCLRLSSGRLVVLAGGSVYYSDDTGVSWTLSVFRDSTTQSAQQMAKLFLSRSGNVLVSCRGQFLVSHDNASGFTTAKTPSGFSGIARYVVLYFNGDLLAFAGSQYLASTDDGDSWSLDATINPGLTYSPNRVYQWQDLVVLNDNSSKIVYSDDHCKTWNTITYNFPSAGTLIAVCSNKGLFAWTPQNGIWLWEYGSTEWKQQCQELTIGVVLDFAATQQGTLLISSSTAIVRSSDDGRNWSSRNNGIEYNSTYVVGQGSKGEIIFYDTDRSFYNDLHELLVQSTRQFSSFGLCYSRTSGDIFSIGFYADVNVKTKSTSSISYFSTSDKWKYGSLVSGSCTESNPSVVYALAGGALKDGSLAVSVCRLDSPYTKWIERKSTIPVKLDYFKSTVQWVEDSTLLIVVDSSLYRSTDGGSSIEALPFHSLLALHAENGSAAVVTKDSIYVSTDAFHSWLSHSYHLSSAFSMLHVSALGFKSYTTACILGRNGELYDYIYKGNWLQESLVAPRFETIPPSYIGLTSVLVPTASDDLQRIYYVGTAGIGAFRTDIVTSVESQPESAEVELYPNPATLSLEITGLPTDLSVCSYRVFSSQGLEVQSAVIPELTQNPSLHLDVSSLNSGVYTISLSSGTRVWLKKFCVVR